MSYIIFQWDSEIIDTFPINWQVSETGPHYLGFCKAFCTREDLCFYLCFENFSPKIKWPLIQWVFLKWPKKRLPSELHVETCTLGTERKIKNLDLSNYIIYKLFHLFPLITLLPLKYISLGIFFSKASFDEHWVFFSLPR